MKTFADFLKSLFAFTEPQSDEDYLAGCADIYELEYRMRNLDRSRRAHAFHPFPVR